MCGSYSSSFSGSARRSPAAISPWRRGSQSASATRSSPASSARRPPGPVGTRWATSLVDLLYRIREEHPLLVHADRAPELLRPRDRTAPLRRNAVPLALGAREPLEQRRLFALQCVLHGTPIAPR